MPPQGPGLRVVGASLVFGKVSIGKIPSTNFGILKLYKHEMHRLVVQTKAIERTTLRASDRVPPEGLRVVGAWST